MTTFIGVKLVSASEMSRADYNALRGWTVPADENPADEGYLVEYRDGGKPNHPDFTGYISWSPKKQFEDAYRTTTGLTFGLAIEALKMGLRVARVGWNGKGMFVYMITPKEQACEFNGDSAHFNPYFAIKNVNGSLSTWVPSINDCLAEDWVIVE